MITKEYLQSLYGDNVRIETCNDCSGQGAFKVIITRVKDTIQINLADFALAASLLSFAKDKGLTNNLKADGDSVSFLTRCVCFQVTDSDGTRTECFLCQEPPDTRCSGPFPYCPSDKSIFNLLDDDSMNYISVINIHLPNEICTGGWMAMNNSNPNRNIRVYYDFNNRPMVCDVPAGGYILLGCYGGNYVPTRSQYI
jgi:hypothetical protein